MSTVHVNWRKMVEKIVEVPRIKEWAISDQLYNSDLCNAKKFRNGKAPPPSVRPRPLSFSLFLKLRKLHCQRECGAICRR